MTPGLFAGIDISKETLGVSVVNLKGEQIAAYKIANTESSIADILGVLAINFRGARENTCFCAEDMGLFTSYLVKVFAARKVAICFESLLRIKKPIGTQRGKNDVIDALRIARYACNNFNSLRFRAAPRLCISDLECLSIIRKHLLKARKLLTQSQTLLGNLIHIQNLVIKNGSRWEVGPVLLINQFTNNHIQNGNPKESCDASHSLSRHAKSLARKRSLKSPLEFG